MVVRAQLSVYPLRQARLHPAIDAVWAALADHGLQSEPGPMSTLTSGEVDAVFAALRDAFARAAESGPVVMVATLSTACPT
jgi:uncharacterized protein YqgV (UPF0045/DUF77 family)